VLLEHRLNEALEQQTASSEVLSVISSSPGKLEPVFSKMLENAARICEAKFAALILREGDRFRFVAFHNAPPAYVELRTREPDVRLTAGTALARAIATKQAAQIADVTKHPPTRADPLRRSFAALTGARTLITVPMLKDDEIVGAINIYRQEVRPFTDKQIELVKNFAAQAVIATSWSRTLRLRRSLRSRTRGCSMNCDSHWSSRPRHQTCCVSSAVRQANWSLSSMRYWKTQLAFARPSSACSPLLKVRRFVLWQYTKRHPHLSSLEGASLSYDLHPVLR
jgi:transcriptional regulator with GAF, ATPase, and Fis domain